MDEEEPSRAARMSAQMRLREGNGRGKGAWTQPVRARFFAELANSCNVKAACGAVGMSVSGAYLLRDRDPSFRMGWRRGIAQGYAKLELQMLERALLGEERLRRVLAKPTTNDERALDLLSRYSARVAETLYRAHRADAIDYDLNGEAADEDDAEAVIEAKVEKLREALAARLEREGR